MDGGGRCLDPGVRAKRWARALAPLHSDSFYELAQEDGIISAQGQRWGFSWVSREPDGRPAGVQLL